MTCERRRSVMADSRLGERGLAGEAECDISKSGQGFKDTEGIIHTSRWGFALQTSVQGCNSLEGDGGVS
jgi:hypothetical protein